MEHAEIRHVGHAHDVAASGQVKCDCRRGLTFLAVEQTFASGYFAHYGIYQIYQRHQRVSDRRQFVSVSVLCLSHFNRAWCIRDLSGLLVGR